MAIKIETANWERAYRAALRRHLAQGTSASLHPAQRLGQQAVALGLETLTRLLHRRALETAASARLLKRSVLKRQKAEAALTKSGAERAKLVRQSRSLHARFLSQTRAILSAQEIDRKKTGLYLQDEVAQQLLAIHLELLALKTSDHSNSATFYKEIAKTQLLLEKTVGMVLRCARELRPAVLDDLGLVPALHAFLKELSKETGIRTSLTASRGLETLSSSKRIVLYRVAQKALTNVIRHAKACRVDVIIKRLPAAVSMQIRDDGQGFDVKKRELNKKCRDSGLMGMRERMAMVGGTFMIESAPGHGTFIRASVPFRPAAKARVSP